MDGDVVLTLSLAKLYAHHANFAGTPRQAIADGYSAVDAVFTALLRHDGKPQPRNHKRKLEATRDTFPDAFKAEEIGHQHGTTYIPGTDWNSLETFYEEWLSGHAVVVRDVGQFAADWAQKTAPPRCGAVSGEETSQFHASDAMTLPDSWQVRF